VNKIYLCLGSNLGDCEKNIKNAVKLMESHGLRVIEKSSVYQSEPAGYKNQPWFLNMAARVETDLKPMDLLRTLKDIEKVAGREKSRKWGPRIIDIDILLYGSSIIDEPGLKIPHIRMHKRRFVLVPLNEIAADAVHPKLKKSIKDLLKECKDASIVRTLL
jgi:2-amino-4-hydroxy-6-hydroxymethyldihydropteridine diphosphokinase